MGVHVLGKYRIIGELGHGGMADVYLAVVEGPAGSGFSKLQVIKTLKPNLAEDPEFVAMFLDEARLAGRLNHPNVVQTHEIGRVGNRYLIAMEYLDGQSLNRLLVRAKRKLPEGGLPINVHLTILCEALAGLHHAHELADYDGTPLNVVHRDATPHNIFVTYAGHIKVVDFGIAKAERRTIETQTGIIKGKVPYMAPEQIVGIDVDRRADVYAAGVMLWEALTGQRLWNGLEHLNIMQALIKGDIKTSPKSAKADVPDELDRICQRALAPNRADRYPTALELQKDIQKYLATTNQQISPDVIADLMQVVFGDKRDAARRVIEDQLRDMGTRRPSDMKMVHLGDAPSGPDRTPSSISNPPFIGETTSNVETVTAPTGVGRPESVRPRRSRASLFGIIVTSSIIAVLALVGTMMRLQKKQEAAAAQSANTAQAQGQVELMIRVSPSEAQISIDDAAPQSNPYVGRFARDGSTHVIHASAAGYVSRMRTVQFTDNAVVDITLDRSPEPRVDPPRAVSVAPGRQITRRPQPRDPDPPPPPPPVVPQPSQPPPPPVVTAPPTPPQRPRKPVDTNNPYQLE